jgi:hypothetical protein
MNKKDENQSRAERFSHGSASDDTSQSMKAVLKAMKYHSIPK